MTRRRSCQTRSWAVAAAVAAPTSSCQASRKGSSAASRGAARGFALRRGAVRCGPCRRTSRKSATQRIDVDPFGRFPLAAPGLAEIEPVRRPVAGAIEAARIHKRLYQYRTAAVLLLPVIGQPPHHHRQHLGSQVPDLDPRKQQKPRVAHHPLQMRLPPVLRPADPRVPAGQRDHRLRELQATQLAPVPVLHEIAQPRTERVAETGIVPAVDKLVPLRDLVLVLHEAKLQWQKFPQWLRNRRLLLRPPALLNRLARTPRIGRILRRQHQEAQPLQFLQKPLAELDPVRARSRAPAQLLANRLPKLVPAQRRKRCNRRLDLGNLLPGQTTTEKRRRTQRLDSGVHPNTSPQWAIQAALCREPAGKSTPPGMTAPTVEKRQITAIH